MKVAQTKRIERAGVNALRTLLEDHNQIVQEIDGGNDYGEDLFVTLTKDGCRTGVTIAIQVKSGEKYKRIKGYAIPVDNHADDWRESFLPVYGVVFDIELESLFWVNLTATLTDCDYPPTWIQVGRERELSMDSIEDFVAQAHEYARNREVAGNGEFTLNVHVIPEDRKYAERFIGRENECIELKRQLAEGVAKRVLIVGMAGVGKTALVTRIVDDRSVRSYFSGGILLVDMHGFSGDRRNMCRARSAYAPLLTAVGVPESDIPADVNAQAQLFHKYLEDCAAAGTNFLLVFDNVAEASQIVELLPRSEKHGVLVTSRVQLGVIDDLETVYLDCMDTEDSVRLISVALAGEGSILDATMARSLCELCGNLPLALHIAAAILKEDSGLEIVDLIEELAEARTRLDVLQYGDTAVRAALLVSLMHLDDDLREKFCRLSVNPGTSISEEIAGVLMEVSVPRARSILRRLSQASLVSRDSARSRWKMHDLVRLFSSEQAEILVGRILLNAHFARMAQRYILIAEEADSALRGAVEPNQRFASVSEYLAWFDNECSNIRGVATRSRDMAMYEVTYYLSMFSVLYLDMRRRTDDSLESSITAYDAARALKDVKHQVRALNNVGIALTSQRKFQDAIRTLTKAAAIAERIGFLEGQCNSTLSLGSAVREHEDPRAAISILVKAYELAVMSQDSGSIASALTNLGSAYRESGEFGPAAQALSASIEFHVRTGNRRREASAHGGLGAVLSQMGQFGVALESYNKALLAYEEVEDKSGVNLTLANLGATYLRMARIEEGKACLMRALSYFTSVGDSYHQALCLANLGNAGVISSEYSEARMLFNSARSKYLEAGSRRGELAVESLIAKLDLTGHQ
ncbi:tetratricopeptide repeat protein [Nocardia salmonicida]|uniref:tetratricopeptide repeat protein n=1 Tax=Nocardia salmonicida TaxID=53431 RepID=UPI003CED7D2F